MNAYLVNAYSTGPEQKQTKQETKVMVKQGDSFGALLSLAGGSFLSLITKEDLKCSLLSL